MTVNLRIAGDGSGEFSVDSFAQVHRHSNQSWRKEAQGPVEPREFAIRPCRTVVRALGSQDIKVWEVQPVGLKLHGSVGGLQLCCQL